MSINYDECYVFALNLTINQYSIHKCYDNYRGYNYGNYSNHPKFFITYKFGVLNYLNMKIQQYMDTDSLVGNLEIGLVGYWNFEGQWEMDEWRFSPIRFNI